MKHKIPKCLLLFAILTVALHIVNAQEIVKNTMQPMNVVYVTDTAVTMESFSPKMEKSYGTLFTLIGQQQLKPGKIMSIYLTISPPWIFDIAVVVDKVGGCNINNHNRIS